MNDKTVITQNTPHKVSVAEDSSNATRSSFKRNKADNPSAIETLPDRYGTPVLQDAVRAFKEFDLAAGNGPLDDVKEKPNDPERALLDDWTLSAELLERIDELRTHNTRINNQIDQLSAPSKKARI